MGIQLFLENVRLSYPKLDLPEYYKGVKQRPNDVKRWDASFIVDPTSTARLGTIKGPQSNAFKLVNESIDKLAVELMAEKAKAWKLRVLTDPKACAWTDGARKEMDGFFVMAAHRRVTDGRPLVLDRDGSSIYKRVQKGVNPTTDKPIYEYLDEVADGKAGRLYAGCFVNAHIELWAQKAPNEGLRCSLIGVQYWDEGESFGGGVRPSDDAFGSEQPEGDDNAFAAEDGLG